MKKAVALLVLISLAASLWMQACKKKDIVASATVVDFKVPSGWPQPQYNFQNNPLTVEGVALGRKLFYDGQLSLDGGFPCASCHQQIAAFGTFDHDRSHGYNQSHTIRNAPPLQNLAWKKLFNADGSASSIEQVALTHISTATEMGETVEHVVSKLEKDPVYTGMFKAAFGTTEINGERLSKALAQFVLTMVSSNSKYDKVLKGEASFTTGEQTGYDLFKAKCNVCHQEPMFTDYNFRNTGMPVDVMVNDYGRQRVTLLSADSLKFGVPGLRNIERTFPYGHDGRFSGLDNVLEHYRSLVVSGPTTDPLVKNKIAMSNYEFGQLKAFMYTLTDTAFLNDKQFSQK